MSFSKRIIGVAKINLDNLLTRHARKLAMGFSAEMGFGLRRVAVGSNVRMSFSNSIGGMRINLDNLLTRNARKVAMGFSVEMSVSVEMSFGLSVEMGIAREKKLTLSSLIAQLSSGAIACLP